jgi:hypothetical protein
MRAEINHKAAAPTAEVSASISKICFMSDRLPAPAKHDSRPGLVCEDRADAVDLCQRRVAKTRSAKVGSDRQGADWPKAARGTLSHVNRLASREQNVSSRNLRGWPMSHHDWTLLISTLLMSGAAIGVLLFAM